MGGEPDVLTAVLVSPNSAIRESYGSRLQLDGYTVWTLGQLDSAINDIRLLAPDLVFVDRASETAPADRLLESLVRESAPLRFAIVCVDLAQPLAGSGVPPGLRYSLFEPSAPAPALAVVHGEAV